MNETPDLEVARYALRTFNVDSGRLMPVAIPVDAWKGGVCEAECVPLYQFLYRAVANLGITPAELHQHEAPAEGCHCGIYGCLTIDRLKRQYPLECRDIVTVIAVEGNTIIGDIGLRTQAARIVAYWSPKRDIRKLCADTCTGAVEFTALDDMLAAYGFEPERPDPWIMLNTPSRPTPTRFGRFLFWANIVCIAVNLGFFVAGLFTSAGVTEQLISLGAAAICTGSLLLTRRNHRKAGAA